MDKLWCTSNIVFHGQAMMHLQERRHEERHCDAAAAVWTLAGNYSENFLNKWSTIVERTWMWRGQSLEFQPSPNSCRRWTGRVYRRPPCVGRRRGRRYPHSLSTPTCINQTVSRRWKQTQSTLFEDNLFLASLHALPPLCKAPGFFFKSFCHL